MWPYNFVPQDIRIRLTRGVALLTLFGVTACGGGGGDSGTGNAALTPAATQPAVQVAQETFAATLTGLDEVPPRATTAQGAAVVVANASSRQALIVTTTTNLAGSLLQLGQAPPGTLGPVVLSIAEALPGSGIWAANTVLTADQYSNLIAGNLHLNALSQQFPEGEIRGQIIPQVAGAGTATSVVGTVLPSTVSFIAALSGAQAIPATTTAAQGAAAITINPVNRIFSAAVLTTGMVSNGAELRENPTGFTVPAVIALAETSAGSGVWTARGTLTETQYAALRQGNFFINVRSTSFPAGEIRGAVLPQTRFASSTVPASATGTIGAGAGTLPTGIGNVTTGIGTGATGTGVGAVGSGFGTSGIGTGVTAIGSGTPGAATGTGITGIGTSGLGASPSGFTTGTGGLGIGTIGVGTTGIGTTGIGTTGIGTTGIGTGTTGIVGTGTSAGFNTTLTGTGTGTGMTTTGLNVNSGAASLLGF
ncbi:CHRD domain-containing protein [Herbaspirillum sp. GCM10030257]|uniref:CHRD domain-containing protein n=1 Tax=Herbaspirillum sp. GCM10030257 TaxID=3273393 RepID=UPI003616E589